MHSSGSFLMTVLEKLRFYLDEAAFDAKFDDDFLVRYFILPAATNVLARLNLNNDDPVVVRHELTLVEGQEFYQLPPNIQEVWRFCITQDSSGRVVADAYPRGEFNPHGPGWSIEGNLLRVTPFDLLNTAEVGNTAHIVYVPTGDVGYHYYNGEAVVGSGTYTAATRTFQLAATPTLGLLEKRPQAYAGMVLRILGANNKWEERIIESFDVTTNKVVIRKAFDHLADAATNVPYEIAPVWSQALYGAIALLAALDVATGRNASQAKLQALSTEYRIYMKTIKDNLSNKQLRTGKYFNKDTVDNPDRGWGVWRGMSQW